MARPDGLWIGRSSRPVHTSARSWRTDMRELKKFETPGWLPLSLAACAAGAAGRGPATSTAKAIETAGHPGGSR